MALSATDVGLCLLARDLVPDTTTTRTFEIPGCGAFMLATGPKNILRCLLRALRPSSSRTRTNFKASSGSIFRGPTCEARFRRPVMPAVFAPGTATERPCARYSAKRVRYQNSGSAERVSYRILYACTGLHTIGGIQRFGHNLVSACRDLGVQVDVLSLSEGTALPACCSGTNPPRLFGAEGSKARWVMTLARCLASESYSAVICGHIHFAPAFAALAVAPWSRSVTSVLVLHGVEVWGRVTTMQRHAANRFNRVLAVSQYTKDSFITQVPGPVRDRISVFPNTISPELVEQSPIPQSWNPTARSLRLLSVARLARSEREKGVLHVLEAMAGLKSDLAVEYTVVGSGDDVGFLRSTAAALGLSAESTFVKHLVTQNSGTSIGAPTRSYCRAARKVSESSSWRRCTSGCL